MQLVKKLVEPGNPFGSCDEADAGDVISSALDQELHGRCEGAAGSEHGIEDVALSPGQVVGQPFGVRGGYQGFLVTHQADESDFGGGYQPGHALEHAEARSQDGHHQRPRGRQLHPDRGLQRRLNRAGGDADVAGCLVREQGDELFGESPESRRVGVLVPEHSELVSDERMVDDA